MSNPKPISAAMIPSGSGSPYPEPLASIPTNSFWRPLGDHFGLTQFGVGLNTLHPGQQSGLRHWHSHEDEFVYVLEGNLTLRVNDGECGLRAGMCIGFKAGDDNAHLLLNHGDVVAHYLIIGARVPNDRASYPDDDLAWDTIDGITRAVHKNGTPYP